MQRHIFTTLFISSLALSDELSSLEFSGVMATHHYTKKDTQHFLIKRHIPAQCQKQEMINNEMVWTGQYAHDKVPQECKSTFVHTTGHLQPIKLHPDLETYGELETLEFIKQMQTRDDMLLIDSRKEKWYHYMTIPSAINMPFHYFKEREDYEFEFEYALRHLGVKIIDDEQHYDFSHVKTILLFCNGPWCSQSPKMIHALLEVGYPPQKIKWYRGGMQSWLGAGLTSTRR